jgi:twitching motility protein PilT
VSQREIGSDTESFHRGLRAALRQDPDVIQIGELRDPETIDTALKAAETGHLVISTLHTKEATSTVARLISAFPPEEQQTVRYRLAEALHAVISQRLLPRADRTGRVVAVEVLRNTAAIADCIRDEAHTAEIRDHIAAGGDNTIDLVVALTATLLAAQGAKIVLRWDGATWPARDAAWDFGVEFLSTNDASATAPADGNPQVGDIWRRHPDAV